MLVRIKVNEIIERFLVLYGLPRSYVSPPKQIVFKKPIYILAASESTLFQDEESIPFVADESNHLFHHLGKEILENEPASSDVSSVSEPSELRTPDLLSHVSLILDGTKLASRVEVAREAFSPTLIDPKPLSPIIEASKCGNPVVGISGKLCLTVEKDKLETQIVEDPKSRLDVENVGGVSSRIVEPVKRSSASLVVESGRCVSKRQEEQACVSHVGGSKENIPSCG